MNANFLKALSEYLQFVIEPWLLQFYNKIRAIWRDRDYKFIFCGDVLILFPAFDESNPSPVTQINLSWL